MGHRGTIINTIYYTFIVYYRYTLCHRFDGRKKGKRGTRDFNEKQKLLHKYKKEMKGAVRELKKDTRFLAREKLRIQMEKDEARKRKVREIMGGLAHQEGEYKRMKLGIKEKTDDSKT